MGNQCVLDTLRAEVDRARDEYFQATQRCRKVCAEAPSALPHPDGTHAVELAARAQTAAMNAYASAVGRFNQFLLAGTIAENLKEAPEVEK